MELFQAPREIYGGLIDSQSLDIAFNYENVIHTLWTFELVIIHFVRNSLSEYSLNSKQKGREYILKWDRGMQLVERFSKWKGGRLI